MNSKAMATENTDLATPEKTPEEMQEWLIHFVAGLRKTQPESIDPSTSFYHYGMDSMAAVTMTTAIGEWLEKDIDPTLPYIYTNITSLSRFLASEDNNE